MSTDTKRKPSDKIGEPPKRWRNWYLAKVKMAFFDRPDVVQAGDIFHGSGVWPSKEVAEEKARLRDGRQPPEIICEYLGAEPEA